jgi:type III secretion protein T
MDLSNTDMLMSALLALGLALPRVLMTMRSIPIFFAQTNPMRVRLACSIAMALPVWVLVYDQLGQRPLAFIEIAWLVGKEVCIGMVFGLLISMPFWILQNMGTITDVQRGNSMFPNSPGSDADSLPTGEIIRRMGVLLFMEMGLMANIYINLLDSFVLWPVLNPIAPIDAMRMDLVVERFNSMMISTVLYASPIVAVLLLIEFGFALLSVYASQIQVTSTTPAVKSLFAVLVLMLGINTLIYVMGHEFNALKDITHVFSIKSKT